MFRLSTRLLSYLISKGLFVVVVVFVSFGFSVVSFTVPAVANLMSSAAMWIAGSKAVLTLSETERLRQQVQRLQRSNQAVTRRNTGLAERNTVLRTQNQGLTTRNQGLTTRNQRLTAENARIQGILTGQRRVVAQAANRIGQRAVRTTSRSIAAIQVESVPVIGIATIIATTAWEIRDACSTLDDMAEIQRHFDLEPDPSFAASACENAGLSGARVAHYGNMTVSQCRDEARAARDRVFELADLARAEVPDLLNREGIYDEDVEKAAQEEFLAVNEICDCILDLSCDLDEFTQR